MSRCHTNLGRKMLTKIKGRWNVINHLHTLQIMYGSSITYITIQIDFDIEIIAKFSILFIMYRCI